MFSAVMDCSARVCLALEGVIDGLLAVIDKLLVVIDGLLVVIDESLAVIGVIGGLSIVISKSELPALAYCRLREPERYFKGFC